MDRETDTGDKEVAVKELLYHAGAAVALCQSLIGSVPPGVREMVIRTALLALAYNCEEPVRYSSAGRRAVETAVNDLLRTAAESEKPQ